MTLPVRIADALTPQLRARIAASIASIGAAPTAKLLGLRDPATVMRVATNDPTVRDGSIAIIVSNQDRLPPLPTRGATGT